MELKLSKLLDHDALFRFAYVPFVVAELVWDYADTVTTLSAMLRSGAKKLCRAVKELRREYEREHAPFIDKAHRDSEVENMYVFEDGVKEIVRLMLLNIHIDLRSEYPDLKEEWIQLLGAVYQCDITLKALLLYTDRQTMKVERLISSHVGHILPEPIYKLNRLLLEFAGDKPVSSRFAGLKKQYIQTLANQMALIELNDISDYTTDNN